jgi:DNA-binding transcriptional MerR regulator
MAHTQRIERKRPAQDPHLRPAQASPELMQRLEQSQMLRDPRLRALWPYLEPRQQQIALDPGDAVGHRFPLTSGEVSRLTGLSERQVRYWADHGLIPNWKKGRRRLFESAGLITAFSITNANQHELQYYRGVMEEPIDELTAKLGLLVSVLAHRLEGIDPNQADQLTAPLQDLTRR